MFSVLAEVSGYNALLTSSSSKLVSPFSTLAPIPLSKLLYRFFTAPGKTPSLRILAAASRAREKVSMAPVKNRGKGWSEGTRRGVGRGKWREGWRRDKNYDSKNFLFVHLFTNVRDEHVLQSSGLAANFAVKIEPPRGQTPLFQHCL